MKVQAGERSNRLSRRGLLLGLAALMAGGLLGACSAVGVPPASDALGDARLALDEDSVEASDARELELLVNRLVADYAPGYGEPARAGVGAPDDFRSRGLALDLGRVLFASPFQDEQGGQEKHEEKSPAEPEETIWTRKRLTGDWWGLRPDMEKHGVVLNARLTQYLQGVATGAANTNTEYGATMDYRVHVDANKLFGATGLAFDFHARTRFGSDITADAGAFVLQNAGLLMPSPGDYHGSAVTGATASYTFPLFSKRLGNVTVGMLDVIDLVTGFFPNIGYGQEGFMNVNGMVTALPWFGAVQGLSLYGGWVLTVNTEYQTIESGFIAAGTANMSTQWGSLSDAFGDGVFLAAFHRFFWRLDKKMGYFMIFAGGSTKEQVSNDPHDFVVIPGQGIVSTDEERPWDVALYLYQDIWQAKGDPRRKANIMIGGTIGPDDPQFAQWHIFGNVEVFGLFASRPNDRTGISGWYNGLSDNFKDLTSPLFDFQDPWGFEFYYNFEFTPWFHLTADVQVVQNQNDSDDVGVLFALRAVIDF